MTKSVLVVSPVAKDSSEPMFVDFNHPKFEGAKISKMLYQSTSSFEKDIKEISESSFEEVYVFVTPDEMMMSSLFSVLKSSGKMLVEACIPSREAGQALSSELQLQGFVDIMLAKDPVTGDRFLTCSKPSWEIGEVAAIKIPDKTNTTATTAWKMSTGDLAEDDLVDEDDLLNDNLDITVGAGCGIDPSTGKPIGKKKACKNCSCGLAELELEAARNNKTFENKEDDPSSFKSSCGSCYKGDAFRCATCPFRGMPAFEPTADKKVLLSMRDDI